MPEIKKRKNFVIFRKMRYICPVKYPGRIFDDKTICNTFSLHTPIITFIRAE